MGWWDCGVLGGDPPLDAIIDIERFVGVEDLYPLDGIDDHAMVASRFAELGLDAICDDVCGRHGNDIGTQVVAVVAMTVGAPLGDFSQRARQAALSDAWAAEDPQRAAAMTQLIDTIDSYDDTPTIVASPGLFETIFDEPAQ